MAEKNHRKIADPVDLNDEDPFAELTRIMGFDPRVSALAKARDSTTVGAKSAQPAVVTPIVPKAAVVPAQVTPAPAARDDFSIDLEKELLGEFADFDEPSHQVAAA